ncbi:hypothetical protein D1631_07730 [Chryseobacterium nematophagum]|uniref:T9SS C-terminal target domain-containing protein n=1 Tax=Chryseobacterium nematophagum TaxID=2305228 RepID=A0A3M7TGS5_9FLAO|nr:hypothetical protein [Chryseobacterium nematophagum]RNA61829.1 hypothetical protein D1631_07730 [Chryseobacterium nematophagum]
MKKTILRAFLCFSLVAAFSSTAISCSSSDDTEESVSTLDPTNFQGKIAAGTTLTLDPTKEYRLTGKLSVENGATLVIPAGTKVVASEGATYLIVERGGKIFINGTASNPVVFEGTQNKQGHWGGLVVLGNAPSNRSASGTSTSELGELIYGGTNTADNSGSIKYVVIKNSGFKYNPEKEFNGLSLFGVGSGTAVSYVYVTDGADDGVECFGGNVNLDHIVVTGVGDDSFDWTEGYNGTVNYLYAARKKEYQNAAEPGNRGIEADTQDLEPNTTNGNGASNPTINNATFLGNTAGSESQALKIRAGSQGKFDNLVLANFSTGLDFETDRTYTWFTSGSYIKNVKFVNITTPWKSKAPAPDMSGVFTTNASATGAGNGTALPDWAKGWTGLTSFDVTNAMN